MARKNWINDDGLRATLFTSSPPYSALCTPDNIYRSMNSSTREYTIKRAIRDMMFSGYADDSDFFETKSFALAHFNLYANNGIVGIIPGEYGVGTFSLKTGVLRCAGALLYPHIEHACCTREAVEAKQKLGLPLPYIGSMTGDIKMDDVYPFRLQSALKEIKNAGTQWDDKNKNSNTTTVLFALQGDVDIIVKCVEWLQKQCGEKFNFVVFPYIYLMKVLSACGKNKYESDFLIELDSQAEAFLMKSTYNYEKCFGCSWHQQETFSKRGLVSICSRNIVYRNIILGTKAILKSCSCKTVSAIEKQKIESEMLETCDGSEQDSEMNNFIFK